MLAIVVGMLSAVRRYSVWDYSATFAAFRIVEIGPAADVYTFPRHPYTRALLWAGRGRRG